MTFRARLSKDVIHLLRANDKVKENITPALQGYERQPLVFRCVMLYLVSWAIHWVHKVIYNMFLKVQLKKP